MTAASPFLEALKPWLSKGLLPTNLNSAELRTLDAALRRQNVFSAQTTIEAYLKDIKDVVGNVLNPVQVERTDADGKKKMVTEGLNPATARERLRQSLRDQGYVATPGEEGSIKDLSSNARINLVVKTNTELAQGAGHFIQQNDPDAVDLYPALELVRFEPREQERNWHNRWRICARQAGDPAALACLESFGRMAALKESDIWQALGDFGDDSLGNPYPPFAFNSGMWTQDVGYAQAVKWELLTPGEKANPAPLDLENLFGFGKEQAA